MADGRISTGAAGLDEVLGGGLPPRRMYLLQGDPGVGKTTLAVGFLLSGIAAGEKTLYVTLGESREELQAVARSHGWSLEPMAIYEMSEVDAATPEETNTLYVPSDVELGERMRALLAEVERVNPARMVIDSCSELRLLAQSPLRFRRQLLALKEQLVRRKITVLLLENAPTQGGDSLLQSLVHGVITLEQSAPLYGDTRRRLRVQKMREVDFRGGYHDVAIRRGGLRVFARLVAADHYTEFERSQASSGVPELDALLGGGPDYGTSTLLVGPAGSGKSALAAQYIVAAAERGEPAALFTFDEGLAVTFARARGLGMDLEPLVAAGQLLAQQIDPAELSPGEFVSRVRDAVERHGAKVVVVDSVNGYLHAMPNEQFLTVQMHELFTFLRQRGVLTLLLMAQHGFVGTMNAPVDISYLADTVVLTRFFEVRGRIRKAISVLKKRAGTHEDTIREFSLSANGIEVGPPLRDFHGVLTGVPEFQGREDEGLLDTPEPRS